MIWSGCVYQTKDLRTCEMHKLNAPINTNDIPTAGCKCNKGKMLHLNECILPKNCPDPVGRGRVFQEPEFLPFFKNIFERKIRRGKNN